MKRVALSFVLASFLEFGRLFESRTSTRYLDIWVWRQKTGTGEEISNIMQKRTKMLSAVARVQEATNR